MLRSPRPLGAAPIQLRLDVAQATRPCLDLLAQLLDLPCERRGATGGTRGDRFAPCGVPLQAFRLGGELPSAALPLATFGVRGSPRLGAQGGGSGVWRSGSCPDSPKPAGRGSSRDSRPAVTAFAAPRSTEAASNVARTSSTRAAEPASRRISPARLRRARRASWRRFAAARRSLAYPPRRTRLCALRSTSPASIRRRSSEGFRCASWFTTHAATVGRRNAFTSRARSRWLAAASLVARRSRAAMKCAEWERVEVVHRIGHRSTYHVEAHDVLVGADAQYEGSGAVVRPAGARRPCRERRGSRRSRSARTCWGTNRGTRSSRPDRPGTRG